MKRYTYIIIFIFASCNVKYEKCTKVIDGDSFYTNIGEVRIYGADCPEATRGHIQPFGIEATKFTRGLIEGKKVKLIIKDHDKYNRIVAKVILPDGSDLSELLIKEGLAWTYRKHSPQSYCKLEQESKQKRIGLWIQDKPDPPYLFRNKNK